MAVAFVFFVNGLTFASWVSRLPALRDDLDLSPSRLGLLLLLGSGGSFAALPLAGPLVARVGPARSVLSGGAAAALGLVVVALAAALGLVPLAGLGLVLAGLGIALWDVAMNVEGADVEHRLARTLMPRLHAAFSVGTVAGALLGAGAAALGVPVSVQLAGTALVLALLLAVSVRAFLPAERPASSPSSPGGLSAWRERRTLLVGLLTLSFAFSEGTANEWLALALTDGYGTSDALGALGFACFVTTMTFARTVGGSLLARHGRPLVLRTGALLAGAGVLLVVLSPSLPLALLGALLWGLGVALGFPVGMSAAADDPTRAALRVSVVSSVAYTAFLVGPPLLGLLAERAGVRSALLLVLPALVAGFLLAGVSRPALPSPAP